MDPNLKNFDENQVQLPVYQIKRFPRLQKLFRHFCQILSNKEAVQIINEFNKKTEIPDLITIISNIFIQLDPKIDISQFRFDLFRQSLIDLIRSTTTLNKSLNESKKLTKIQIATKNLQDTIPQFEKSIKSMIDKNKFTPKQSKSFNLQQEMSKITQSFTNFQNSTDLKGIQIITTSNIQHMVNLFKDYENLQKSIYGKAQSIFNSFYSVEDDDNNEITLPWKPQQVRYRETLSFVFSQLLFIFNFKDQINELQDQIRFVLANMTKCVDNDSPQKKTVPISSIFHKEKPADDTVDDRIVEISTQTATPAETQMMENRITAFSKVIEQAHACPKPYDTIKELEKENERLNELSKDGWVTSQQYDALKEDNRKLKQKIEELEAFIDIAKQKLALKKRTTEENAEPTPKRRSRKKQ